MRGPGAAQTSRISFGAPFHADCAALPPNQVWARSLPFCATARSLAELLACLYGLCRSACHAVSARTCTISLQGVPPRCRAKGSPLCFDVEHSAKFAKLGKLIRSLRALTSRSTSQVGACTQSLLRERPGFSLRELVRPALGMCWSQLGRKAYRTSAGGSGLGVLKLWLLNALT